MSAKEPAIYKMSTYLPIGGAVALVDYEFGEDRELLIEQAKERKARNNNYLILLVQYNVKDVLVVE
jgi:hypothetical protein